MFVKKKKKNYLCAHYGKITPTFSVDFGTFALKLSISAQTDELDK